MTSFSSWIARHQKWVFQVCRRFAANTEEAGELAQSVFLKTWEAKAAGKLPKEESEVRAWMARVAINAAKNAKRQHRRWLWQSAESLVEFEHPELTPEEAASRSQQLQAARRAVLSLPERQRDVFILRVDAELRFSEIASAMGITESNAKAHFHLAMKALKEQFRLKGEVA